jgi:hypothetical protein
MMNNGWFTIGTVSFITETERKDGKGSFLSVYIRFGTEKTQVRKAKVWARNYIATGEGFAVRDVDGGWATIEVGSDLTAYGEESTYKVEGNERVGYVLSETSGLEAFVPSEVESEG